MSPSDARSSSFVQKICRADPTHSFQGSADSRVLLWQLGSQGAEGFVTESPQHPLFRCCARRPLLGGRLQASCHGSRVQVFGYEPFKVLGPEQQALSQCPTV